MGRTVFNPLLNVTLSAKHTNHEQGFLPLTLGNIVPFTILSQHATGCWPQYSCCTTQNHSALHPKSLNLSNYGLKVAAVDGLTYEISNSTLSQI